MTNLAKAFPPAGSMLPDTRGGWFPVIREAFTGAWQMNIATPLVDVLSHPTVFACITLIAGDFKKMRLDFVREEANDVWVPDENPAFSPVLRAPNGYQNPGQFRENWLISKLISGNTYALKVRDGRGIVTQLYILDPARVRPFVSPDGSVFYELRQDVLATVEQDLVYVPAREIIHDRFNTFFSDLVGISPLYAAAISAMLGLRIQSSSTNFFGNSAMPGGIITTPGMITQPKADELQARWSAQFGGPDNSGKVAVMGDGMKFEGIAQTAQHSQLNEQWMSAAEAIAVCFHVPFYLVGGPMPPYNNIQALNVQYYTQCIHPLAKSFEDAMDVGLGLAPGRIDGVQYGVQFNVKDLLWMDSLTQMQVIREGIGAGVLKPNEGRADLNLLPVTGGDTPYLQQQNFSLEALNRRDTAEDVEEPQVDATEPDQVPTDAMAAAFEGFLRKGMDTQAAA